jgi:hypothetical protein
MTNDPLDPDEFPLWLKGAAEHSQFRAVLRLDRILCTWRDHRQAVTAQGYAVDAQVSGKSVSEVRRFLTDWSKRMKPGVHGLFFAGLIGVSQQHNRRPVPSGSRLACVPRLGIGVFSDDWRP